MTDNPYLYALGMNKHDMEPAEAKLDPQLAHDIRKFCGLEFETSTVPMWVHDRRTLAFVAVNAAAIAYYGYSREEFLQMTMLDIRPVEDIPKIIQSVLYPHFSDPAWQLRRHQDKHGKVLDVGIKSFKVMFQGREAELVLVDVTGQKKNGRVTDDAH